jgi:hypothetical protein
MGLALPVLMALFMGTVEISRLLNIYVTANRICRRATLSMAAPDITSSRNPLVGIRSLRYQLRNPADLSQWNQAYAPLILSLQRCKRSESYVQLDVNKPYDGSLFSEVRLVLSLPPLVIPTVRGLGFIPVIGRGLAMNEMQSSRRDVHGVYDMLQVPIESILQHPEDPLPELPSSRR